MSELPESVAVPLTTISDTSKPSTELSKLIFIGIVEELVTVFNCDVIVGVGFVLSYSNSKVSTEL